MKKTNQSRREFFKSLGIAAVATAAIPAAVISAKSQPKNPTFYSPCGRTDWKIPTKEVKDPDWVIKPETWGDPSYISLKDIDTGNMDEARKDLIAHALETPEGRIALSCAMVEPIRRSLDYRSFLRRVFKNQKISNINHDESFMHPTMDCTSKVKANIRLIDIKRKLFYLVDKAQIDMNQQLLQDEFDYLNMVLENALPTSIVNCSGSNGYGLFMGLKELIRRFEVHSGNKVERILMHPKQYNLIKEDLLKYDKCDLVRRRVVLLSGIFARIGGAEVLVSRKLKEGVIYLLPSEDLAGDFYYEDIRIKPNDSPARLTIGWETVDNFKAVVKDGAVSKIMV